MSLAEYSSVDSSLAVFVNDREQFIKLREISSLANSHNQTKPNKTKFNKDFYTVKLITNFCPY